MQGDTCRECSPSKPWISWSRCEEVYPLTLNPICPYVSWWPGPYPKYLDLTYTCKTLYPQVVVCLRRFILEGPASDADPQGSVIIKSILSDVDYARSPFTHGAIRAQASRILIRRHGHLLTQCDIDGFCCRDGRPLVFLACQEFYDPAMYLILEQCLQLPLRCKKTVHDCRGPRLQIGWKKCC